MGFAQDTGYVPTDIETIMTSIMDNINTQFDETFTFDTFQGTNFYKYFYALAQDLQKSEVATSEIFALLQQYIEITNEMIQRPVVTNPGLLENLTINGYVASIKKMIDADAGKVSVCVDTDSDADDYADVKLDICTIIKDSTAAGTVSQGTETESIALTNGQSFDFKFSLPNVTNAFLRLTTILSENNQVVIKTPEEIKSILIANIAARYKLGKNFEPKRYFSVADAPWSGDVTLEWSDDAGMNWHDEIFEAAFDDLFEIELANITLVED